MLGFHAVLLVCCRDQDNSKAQCRLTQQAFGSLVFDVAVLHAAGIFVALSAAS